MRLLRLHSHGDFSFTKDLIEDIPQYAILSHTWGADDSEVTFSEMKDGSGRSKAGYAKIRFCAEQARKDGLEYIWVDTCCIDKANYTELAEAITSMFRWYRASAKCYVYLSDVSTRKRARDQAEPKWRSEFLKSRWFTRGWTLQELLAPRLVDFFSKEGERLGDKNALDQAIHETTQIPLAALHGTPISSFSIEERLEWAAKRDTKKKEDKAYCLLGIFNVFIPLIYGEGDNAFKRLKDAISPSSGRDSLHIKEQFLDSLNEGSPFTRAKNIPKSSEGTFEWILDSQSSDTSSPEVQFREWLREGEGVFWIKGKPGSGKSTLTKFLAGLNNHNQRTLRCLKDWAAPKDPCILSFYFLLADTSNLQNSFRGFLSHLLHQSLPKSDPEAVSSLIAIHHSRQKVRINDWDLEELETTLKSVARRVAKETPLCFFIDALDECVPNDLDRVVKFITELTMSSDSKIKFCVSSRPEQKIENRLRDLVQRSLELHTLTKGDIKRYVTAKLENCWQGGILPSIRQKQRLIDHIVGASEGVFLWAYLVTRKLCESIEFGDTIGEIQEQLNELPHDMMELYEAMLEKSDATKGYRKAEAASYFKFVIDHRAHSMYHFTGHTFTGHASSFHACEILALAHFLPLYETYHGPTQSKDRPNILQIVKRRVNLLCAGIISVGESDPSGRVDFFHRTARDFFHESCAKNFLEHCNLTELERFCLFVDGICGNRHGICKRGVREMSAHEASYMIRWARDMKETTELDRLKYVKHINKTMSQAHAMKNRVIKDDWVYEQSTSDRGDDEVLDFLGLTLRADYAGLLFHCLSTEQDQSQEYKDYLLLCSANRDLSLVCRQHLLDLRANPNARFYWGMQERLKTSPWLKYLIGTQHNRMADISGTFDESRNNELDMDAINAFLDNGASLDDRTVLLKIWVSGLMSPFELRKLPPKSSHNWMRGTIFVIEVNARYLLEEHCRPENVKESIQTTDVLSRADVQKSQSHRQILLIHPGKPVYGMYFNTSSNNDEDTSSEDGQDSFSEDEEDAFSEDKVDTYLKAEVDAFLKDMVDTFSEDEEGTSSENAGEESIDELTLEIGTKSAIDRHGKYIAGLLGDDHPPEFAEVSLDDSERLLNELKFLPHVQEIEDIMEPFATAGNTTLDIWQRSPKVLDVRQYLEEKGYYKRADDPAIPKGPIPMYEEDA